MGLLTRFKGSAVEPSTSFAHQLRTKLLKLDKENHWLIENAVEGVQIFGGVGSGKTSGSGRTLAHAYLNAGFGGLVLCAKIDEADNWIRYAQECGREKSVFRFSPENKSCFNFLEYEMLTGYSTNNTVEVLMNVLKSSKKNKGESADNEFWDISMKSLLTNSIEMLYCAYGRVNINELFEFIESAPKNPEQLNSDQWKLDSFHFKTLAVADNQPANPLEDEDFNAILAYFANNWATMADKTRSNIFATLSATVERFRRGMMRKMFSGQSNFIPDLIFHGAIVIVDMPIRKYHDDGRIAQYIIKYAFQRAAERRTETGVNDETRPVFLWMDEAQEFLSDYDIQFQATSRSARVATVCLTQSYNSYVHRVGGANADADVRAFLSNLRTKIFHSSDEVTTCNYASEMVGKAIEFRQTISQGQSIGVNQTNSSGQNQSGSTGYNQSRGFNRGGGSSQGMSVNDGNSAGRGGSWSWGDHHSNNNWSKGWNEGESVNQGSSSNWGQNASGGSNRGFSKGTSHTTAQGVNEGENRGLSWAEHKELILEPDFFRTLKTGGETNDLNVEAVIIAPNLPKYLICKFKQN